MKKLNYLLLGAAGLLMASCSNEEPVAAPAQGDGTVTLSINLPAEMATRADLGSGKAAQNLTYYIYEVDTETSTNTYKTTVTKTGAFAGVTSTQVTLDLLKGKEYNVVFFAYNPIAFSAGNEESTENSENVYSIDADTGNLTVDYGEMTSTNNNNDIYDCFYAVYNVTTNNYGDNATVTLTRPVAQINWGSNDLENDLVQDAYFTNGSNIYTTLKVTDMPTEFNLFNGQCGTEELYTGTIGTFAIPVNPEDEEAQTFPVNGYSYVASQYVLASGTYNLNLTISNAEEEKNVTESTVVTVSSAPLKPNYQTNIYGSLLTNQANLTITLDSGFGGTENINTTWDGKTVTYPNIDTEKQTATISAASDLAGLAEMINGKNLPEGVDADFADYTFTLADDIDLGGHPFPGLGSATRNSAEVGDNSNAFRGTFDGNSKTISNLTVSYTGDNNDAAAAFIPNLDGDGKVQNVTFENISINGGIAEQAGVIGLVTGGATVTGVTVKSGSISASEGAGGIVGRVLKNGTITGCENNATITVSSKNAGGIAGAAYYSETDGCKITIQDCTNNGDVFTTTNAAVGNQQQTIGGIVGTCAANVIECINNGNVGNENIVAPAGGIVGYMNSCGSVVGCTNNGTVQGNAEIGGIVGFLGGGKYDFQEIIKIEGNTNSGALIGTGSTGGILGINRNTVNLIGNTNSAPSINCTNGNAAGIVGNGYAQGNPVSGGNGYCNLTGNNTNNTPLDKITGKVTNAIYTGVIYLNGELQPQVK